MPASRCGFKTKLLCSTPRRKRRRPMDSMTGSTVATKDYGAVNLHRSAFISAIPRRSTDHPDSEYGSDTEGCVDSLNGAASLECRSVLLQELFSPILLSFSHVLCRWRAGLPARSTAGNSGPSVIHQRRNVSTGARSPLSLKKKAVTAPVTMISTHSTKSRVNSIRVPLCDQSQPYLTLRPRRNGGLNAVITNPNVASANTNFCGLFKLLRAQSKCVLSANLRNQAGRCWSRVHASL